jgi:two-component system chemotaxis response regulator CheB
MTTGRNGHDLIAIGASLGGVEALMQLAAGLPENLPAAVLVTLHTSPSDPSKLPEVLSRQSALPVVHAVHGETILPGRIIVAPPDNHLIVRAGWVNVIRGPKENGHRPSVDVMFRTSAAAYGSRAIGVVLTGLLDCGTAGLMSIKARKGLAVVQDPSDAFAPEMPSNAIANVDIDYVVPLSEIPTLLVRLAREPASAGLTSIADHLGAMEGREPGLPAEMVCPHCHGELTESRVGSFHMFRCHVGHAFSLESLAVEHADQVERALWSAVRALKESAAIAQRLAGLAEGSLREKFEERWRARADEARLLGDLVLGQRSEPERLRVDEVDPEPAGPPRRAS